MASKSARVVLHENTHITPSMPQVPSMDDTSVDAGNRISKKSLNLAFGLLLERPREINAIANIIAGAVISMILER